MYLMLSSVCTVHTDGLIAPTATHLARCCVLTRCCQPDAAAACLHTPCYASAALVVQSGAVASFGRHALGLPTILPCCPLQSATAYSLYHASRAGNIALNVRSERQRPAQAGGTVGRVVRMLETTLVRIERELDGMIRPQLDVSQLVEMLLAMLLKLPLQLPHPAGANRGDDKQGARMAGTDVCNQAACEEKGDALEQREGEVKRLGAHP
eukprot:CAMPEP_0181205290 /NCGR_PEP_ID=MMETSP1096-20121128/20394_1 /TAXON_ID=156174 ORGANISM="Chrysochromulina ericina, Strain CCMP281" /NCGR_SAMPLE_ID=MMETSP1096 /ASSEMBLY_ACC=CAM_ASM_000453 /LENGTH=209 /DNA_ID=CAMNT_0023296055 /DNA_START=319 /DNA_END=948 /DNA_ORIENTATION=+